MSEDESQTKEAPQINAEITCIQEEETLRREFQTKVLARAKVKKELEAEKKPSEAERLFSLFFPEASHWKPSDILLPFDPITYIPYLKQVALAILGTGIIGESGLKGHTGHKEFFPVDQRDLIGALVATHFKYTDSTFYPGDILRRFDRDFDSMAAIASLAGVTDKKINDIRDDLQKWRDKISQAVSQGNFPSNWRELMKEELISAYEYHPKTEAQAVAIIFLAYAPKAGDLRIATWVHAVLKSLGRPTASNSKLREYIKKERKLRPWLFQELSENPL